MVGGRRVPAGRLLDRAEELRAITLAINSAVSGSGSALLVEGVAGIGKTRLMLHACQRAAAAGLTVLTARAAEFEGGYAWGVVRQLFEPVMRAGGGPRLAGDAARLAGPALALGTQSERDSFAVLHGLYWLTVAIAERTPLLLAVDDLHWADQPSLRFIAHLARRLDGLPVLLVLTVREPRSGTAQDKAMIAGLAAETGVAVLRPGTLGRSACAALLRGALGQPPSAAFLAACRERTGGNPLLLRALLSSLAAEGVAGTDADVPRLQGLTPGSVSRSVVLQLGRMPPAAVAAARAVAVLGTTATVARAGWLAGLDGDTAAEAIGALMADGLIEGERVLRFVHPLVRSAVYQDMAPPLRQHWHGRAARLLDAGGASLEEVTVHLLAAGAAGSAWVTERLRAAAADARGRGAPDVARLCLERALAEPPPAGDRPGVLFELGRLEIMRDPVTAAGHLAAALDDTPDWPGRGAVALALSEAQALCGRFAEAVAMLGGLLAEPGAGPSAAELEAAMLNTARWDLDTRPATRPLLDRVQTRAAGGGQLSPQLHANLAIELAAAGQDREGAVRHAREAVRATHRLMSVTSTALPEAVSVLLFAGLDGEAGEQAQTWLRLAQRRGWPLATAVAASVAALIAQYGGEVSEAAAYGQQSMEAGPGMWVASIAAAFMVPALIDRGALDEAWAVLAARDLAGELPPTWPFNVARHARGCLHAAAGAYQAALADLLAAGDLAVRWGIRNPAMMAWRSDAALCLLALGDQAEARRLCAEETELACQWGAARAIGVATRAAGLAEGGDRGIELLTEAVSVLRGSPARLELARALIDLGAAARRAGARARAQRALREGMDIAHSLGGAALADRARRELVVAGGRPRRTAIRGRDALTPSELRVAQLALGGHTNRQIAQALFVTQRTVENHLTSTYGKLEISTRSGLRAALADEQC